MELFMKNKKVCYNFRKEINNFFMNDFINRIFQKGSGGHFNRISPEDSLEIGSRNYFSINASRKISVNLIVDEVVDEELVNEVTEKKEVVSKEEIAKRQEVKNQQMKTIWKETIIGVEKEIGKIAKIFTGEAKLSKEQLEEYIESIINNDDEAVVAIFEDIFAQKLANPDSIIVLMEKQREILLNAIGKMLPKEAIKRELPKEENSQEEKEITINLGKKKGQEVNESPFLKEVSEVIKEEKQEKLKNSHIEKNKEVIKADIFASELPKFVEVPVKDSKDNQSQLEEDFKKAISLISDISKEEFLEKYGNDEKPMFIGDYRDLLGNVLIYMNDHHIDKFSDDAMEKFRAAVDIVYNLNKKGHKKKMVVCDGMTYLIEKKEISEENSKFKLESKEKEFILSHLSELVNLVEEEFASLKLEKIYLGELKDEFFRVKMLSLLSLSIKEHFNCSDEEAINNARKIFEDFKKITNNKKN
jgi:hypothetical protein